MITWLRSLFRRRPKYAPQEPTSLVVGPWVETRGPQRFQLQHEDGRLEQVESVSRSFSRAGLCYRSVPYGNFTVYTTDGMGDESGHSWGNGHPTDSPEQEKYVEYMKKNLDAMLRGFGWTVPRGTTKSTHPGGAT